MGVLKNINYVKTLVYCHYYFFISCSSSNLKNSYGMKVISYPDLNVCRGEFNVKRWTNCTGFLNFKNNHTYQGPFLNGKKHGRGVYTWPNGDTFVGEFDNGIYTQGIYKWNNGNKYIGEFKSVFKNSRKVYNKHGLGISKNNNEIYIGDFFKIITME